MRVQYIIQVGKPLCLLLVSLVAVQHHAFSATSVELPGHGSVGVTFEGKEDWDFSLERIDDGSVAGLFEIRFSASSKSESVPPTVCVVHEMPQGDVRFRLAPCGTMVPPIPWQRAAGMFVTFANGYPPVQTWLAADDGNRLTHACSDQSSILRVYGYERDVGGSSLRSEIEFFAGGARPISEYSAVLRLDFRKVPYWEAFTGANDWIASFPGQMPLPVPDAAYEPLWDTWYAYHCDYDAVKVEQEGDAAAELGIKTVVYDMGWDCHGNTNASFVFCGDWTPDPIDFPDMKGHIARMHSKGIRCLLWLGVPLLGREARNLERFGKCILPEKTRSSAQFHVLDPRFPEVRRFVVDSARRGIAEWGADGWKIDFLQRMTDGDDDPVRTEGLGGRDIRWVYDAARDLQEEISASVCSVRPDALFEYMLGYCGILGQRAATHMRASDCPGDVIWNRNQTARLRLMCGNRVAVHSDPLLWGSEASAEDCGLQFVSVIHSVLQLSVRLTELTQEQKRVVRHWIAFSRDHRDTLLRGKFRPHAPYHSYPLIEMESAAERIVSVFQRGQVVPLAADRPTFALNGTDFAELCVDVPSEGVAEMFDTFGTLRERRSVAAGLVRLPVPRAGFVKFYAKNK